MNNEQATESTEGEKLYEKIRDRIYAALPSLGDQGSQDPFFLNDAREPAFVSAILEIVLEGTLKLDSLVEKLAAGPALFEALNAADPGGEEICLQIDQILKPSESQDQGTDNLVYRDDRWELGVGQRESGFTGQGTINPFDRRAH